MDDNHKEYIRALQTLYRTTEIEFMCSDNGRYIFKVNDLLILIKECGDRSWTLKKID